MACGCSGTCNCTLAAGPGISIAQGGGADFTISAIQFVSSVLDSACIDLTVVDGVLSAAPILADSDTVELTCELDGLTAEVVIDPSSTAEVTVSSAGIKIDVPEAPALPDSVFPGTIRTYAGLRNPVGWLDADGSDIARVDEPDLHDALSLLGTTASVTSGSPIVTGIDSTRFIAAGMPAEATNFGPGTTVVSVDSSSQLTLSTNASATATGSATVRAYPHGNGNGSSTFSLPDTSRNVEVGFDYNGAIGSYPSVLGNASIGAEMVGLVPSELAAHDHPGSVLGGSLSVATTITGSAGDTVQSSTDGGHAHGPGSPGRSFVTAEPPLSQALIRVDGTDDVGIQLGADAGLGVTQQTNNAFTDTHAGHFHFTNAALIAAKLGATSVVTNGLTVDVAEQGTGAPHQNMQPSIVMRKIIKT